MSRLNATSDYFAYTVARTLDDQAWEVNTRVANIYSALTARYSSCAEARTAEEA
ncbi:hypothetical protein KQH60_12060 [Mycetohabitans sp. B8]|uniref:hypothetical protein n=1 Tax=Mycetohabitans sp. B8 TaxID=2841845 RepID=UPI001F2DC894|nr:hypothetical protein [Mycetohabitans sp. B8]MCG1043230.1 hypothetical protein [Mycetohabitans sp. B8]